MTLEENVIEFQRKILEIAKHEAACEEVSEVLKSEYIRCAENIALESKEDDLSEELDAFKDFFKKDDEKSNECQSIGEALRNAGRFLFATAGVNFLRSFGTTLGAGLGSGIIIRTLGADIARIINIDININNENNNNVSAQSQSTSQSTVQLNEKKEKDTGIQ